MIIHKFECKKPYLASRRLSEDFSEKVVTFTMSVLLIIPLLSGSQL